MALFEGYERRIEKINSVLNKYGISSLEEAKKVVDATGVDVYNIVKGIQPICFENTYKKENPVEHAIMVKASESDDTEFVG